MNKFDDAFIPVLKVVLNRFVTNKMLEKRNYIVLSNDDIVFCERF